MPTLVPLTERERLYFRWYELSMLYHEAIRHDVDESEVRATKAAADEAWLDYVETISDLNGPRRE